MKLISLKTRHATATVSPYGAQVMSFIPNGGEDVLWATSQDYLEAALVKGKALRGGIPLCWPWFLGMNAVQGAPSHGVGRITEWREVGRYEDAEVSTVTLICELDGSDPAWPHKTLGQLTVTLKDTLLVELVTTNLSDVPFTLTQALHTYVCVGVVGSVEIDGVDGLERRWVASGERMDPYSGTRMIEGEVEELVSPVQELVVIDPVLTRKVVVTNHGSREFVIWNPGAEKAANLDMPAGSFTQMVCLEAANIDAAVTVQAGAGHTISTELRVEAL